jgi:DNA-directed RNA polymerase delta subunit
MYSSQDNKAPLTTIDKDQKIQMNLNDVLEDIFMVLSDKEKDIIVQRFSLDNKPKRTLEYIGQKFSITRERVRQIENIALGKLRRVLPNTGLRIINELAKNFLKKAGGVLLEDTLVSKILLSLNKPGEVDGYIIKLALNIDNSLIKQEKSFEYHPFWYESSISSDWIRSIVQTTYSILKSKGDVMGTEQLVSLVLGKITAKFPSVTPEMVASCFDIDKRFKKTSDGYGLMEWRHINPKSIRDKACIVLKEAKHPLHFVEIANRILNHGFDKKMVTTQAVHNELIRDEQFVLVGRGLYALKEWGYKPGTVADVIESILEKAGKPLKKQEIIQAVLKQRTVKVGTISLNLQNFPQFVRVGRAVYTLDKSKKK